MKKSMLFDDSIEGDFDEDTALYCFNSPGYSLYIDNGQKHRYFDLQEAVALVMTGQAESGSQRIDYFINKHKNNSI